MVLTRRAVIAALFVAVIAGCAPPREMATQDDVDALGAAIFALDPNVDRDEAARAARIAYAYTEQLAIDYEIVDPPLVHNFKVNAGIKPRGLCWHWAEDMENRLNAEQFQTLVVHRAIAEHPILIDHSTAIIAASGDDFDDGLVIDPWRNGGVLFWAPVRQDTRYDWQDRMTVLRARR